MVPISRNYDVVVVGGGFGGTHILHRLRNRGFSTHMFEAGAQLGGIWYWNNYPGARVDTECPVYQLTEPELYKDWSWTERYPGRDELVDYFEHVADVWKLKSDISFNSRVTKAYWNPSTSQWDLKVAQTTVSGITEVDAYCNSIVWCTGFASKPYTPPFIGMENFKGTMAHTANWTNDVDFKDKRVAVIGTGASGVQVIQTVAPDVKSLTVFQRTPNLALPMGQKPVSKERNDELRQQYPNLVKKMKTTYAGFLYDFDPRKCFEVSEEERMCLFEELYNKGGVYFWLGTFSDILKNKEANDLAYDYWRQRTLERIKKPEVAEKLAPKTAPHPYGTKRVSLEQNYYEAFNQDNVELVDMKACPVETFTERGIKTKDGDYEFDIICLATGFDAITGGLTQVDIRGENGLSIKDKWAQGTWTHLGITTAGFPNMFMVYSPQAPTAFATGPACAEAQGDWIENCLVYLRDNQYRSIQPTHEAEVVWKDHVNTSAQEGLFSQTKSWYFGDNIPGKAREALNYMAGMPSYKAKCKETAVNGYRDFVLV